MQSCTSTRSKDSVSSIHRIQTVGPTNACINFHCDGIHASGTLQIALNELTEYDRGCLVFFVDDKVHVLEHPSGSLCQHPPKVSSWSHKPHCGSLPELECDRWVEPSWKKWCHHPSYSWTHSIISSFRRHNKTLHALSSCINLPLIFARSLWPSLCLWIMCWRH